MFFYKGAINVPEKERIMMLKTLIKCCAGGNQKEIDIILIISRYHIYNNLHEITPDKLCNYFTVAQRV